MMRFRNILTIDLEDWFQVSNLDDHMPRDRWHECELRLWRNTELILRQLEETGRKATFFVLGWNAEKCPGLIREIAMAGHELATHGYSHRLIYSMTPDEFRDDLRRSIDVIEDAAGERVRGHRAASFSLTEQCLWALEIMAAEGITYDSSTFPIKHDRYGVPKHWIKGRDIVTRFGSIIEIPITVWPLMGINIPFAGGGYFRLLPYKVTKRITHALNLMDKRVVFYFHPWEMDPGIPHLQLGLLKSFRSYHNIAANASKFAALLREFDFGPVCDVIKQEARPVRTLRRGPNEEWVLL